MFVYVYVRVWLFFVLHCFGEDIVIPIAEMGKLSCKKIL